MWALPSAVVRSGDSGERGGHTSGSFLAVPLLKVTSCMLSAVICNRTLLTVRQSVAQDRYASLLALAETHASLTLRPSATRRGRAPTSRPHRTPHAAPVCVGARGLAPSRPQVA
jgi:hypothetical protein